MQCMAKKKKQSGEHVAPRKPVQLPADWLKLAQEMAAKRPMPVMWLIVELIKQKAEAEGRTDLPPTPWQPPASST